MKTVFGVFGDPVEHSLSPDMHNAAFSELGTDSIYHAFRVDKKSLEYALNGASAMGFGGVNITVPLKQEAIKFVNTDPLASRIGAVNTIDFRNENEMIGYNTDGVGARRAIADAGVDIKNKKILI
uniref:shikimate dehydrogenase family protein n=1 Tax=Methanohalobium sp. TaxID=2837493 RepID=UPI0034E05BC5